MLRHPCIVKSLAKLALSDEESKKNFYIYLKQSNFVTCYDWKYKPELFTQNKKLIMLLLQITQAVTDSLQVAADNLDQAIANAEVLTKYLL